MILLSLFLWFALVLNSNGNNPAEEEDGDETPEEGDMLLTDMWDHDHNDDETPFSQTTKKSNSHESDLVDRFLGGSDSDGASSEQEGRRSDDESLDEIDTSDNEDNDLEAYSSMLSAIRGSENSTKQKKRITEESLSIPESQFSGLGDLVGSRGGLSMADLLAGSDGTAGTKVKKQLAKLRKDTKAKALPEPLADIHQQELTRKVGFSKAKEHVSRWDATVAKHRDAEHLVFPLQAAPRNIVSSATLQVSLKHNTMI